MSQHLEIEFNQIINGCRKKNRESQHALYRLYYPYAMSIAIRYVNSESEAISITNDSFLKVFKHIQKYDQSLPFKPWFRRILVNTAISSIKSQKKYRMEVDMNEAQEIAAREDVLSRIGYKELIAMVQSLSMAYRTVFNMYVIDGFKHKEIAAELGITEATSKSNLTRARAKLRELVINEMSE
ncbi:MAG TPA: sigma-70 family RNA polymerase sigma factor [Saprospiraceae bacterium]|nr:sigma-70 family RNA polymerase sigma factor [Saprospiraceae bacterium]